MGFNRPYPDVRGRQILETMRGSVGTPVPLFRLSYILKHRAGPKHPLHAPQALQ